METPIRLEVLTPVAMLASLQVCCVTLPGVQGTFQVLRDHAPLLTALDAGVIRYRLADGSESEIPVRKGFVEVCDNLVTVCVEG